MRGRLGILVGVLPVIVATAAAGVIDAPSKQRPCATGYSKGFTGGPSIFGGP